MKGYKATDKDMRCKSVQFELDKWFECDGDLELCKNGFHFCEQPSGVWAYYDMEGARVFEVEAEDVLNTTREPGADFKRVCRRIKLVREIIVAGDWNTGNGNTGYGNTGYGNTGNRNTGYGNATSFSSGFFCTEEPSVVSFDVDTKLTTKEYLEKYSNSLTLCKLLYEKEDIDFELFKDIPGITKEKLKALHGKHLAAKERIK